MKVRTIREYIESHYEDHPNFGGRTVEEIMAELPDQDERYGQGEDGLADLLNEVEYATEGR